MMPEPNLIFLQRELRNRKFWRKNCNFFTRAGVWNPFNKCWFVGNQQKMKGRASQISCLSRKVRSMKWRPFWGIVKNARFHPTKHLSQWVSSQLEIGNLLFFGADRDFRLFFVPDGLFSSEMTTMSMPNGWLRSAVKKTNTKTVYLLVGQGAEILAPDNILWFFPQTGCTSTKFATKNFRSEMTPPPHFKVFPEIHDQNCLF